VRQKTIYWIDDPDRAPDPDPDPDPVLTLDNSEVGGRVPDELRNLRIEPPPQPDRVAIARAAVAKLSSDETIALIGEWVDRASVEQRQALRTMLDRIDPNNGGAGVRLRRR
jgi:hypothetical protein